MKLNKFALTLTAAALLPTFANAGTDAVVASFERGLLDGAAVVTVAVAEADPLDSFYSILNTKEDAVAASFKRDWYREPVPATSVIAGANDPLAEIFHAALGSEIGKPVKQAAVTSSHRITN